MHHLVLKQLFSYGEPSPIHRPITIWPKILGPVLKKKKGTLKQPYFKAKCSVTRILTSIFNLLSVRILTIGFKMKFSLTFNFY